MGLSNFRGIGLVAPKKMDFAEIHFCEIAIHHDVFLSLAVIIYVVWL